MVRAAARIKAFMSGGVRILNLTTTEAYVLDTFYYYLSGGIVGAEDIGGSRRIGDDTGLEKVCTWYEGSSAEHAKGRI
jgi:hypothetical protein